MGPRKKLGNLLLFTHFRPFLGELGLKPFLKILGICGGPLSDEVGGLRRYHTYDAKHFLKMATLMKSQYFPAVAGCDVDLMMESYSPSINLWSRER